MAIEHDVAARLSTDLMKVYKLFGCARQHSPRRHDAIEPTAYPLLFALVEHPRRVSEIAEVIHSDLSVVSRQVSHLVEHGIVAKRPDEHDGRAQVIALSDEGAEVVRQLRESRAAWLQELMSDWDPADAAAFDRYLGQFIRTLDGRLDDLRSGAGFSTTHL